jgi:hypothetical protein
MKRPERLFRQLVAAPRQPEVDKRKQRFEALNKFISQRNGWMTSVPGDPDMTFEALPGSPLADQLRDNGYEVTEIGTTQRILPHAIEDKYVIGAGGDLELVTAGSTQPITQTVTHAGIVTTTVYELRMPTTVSPDQGTRIVP